MTVVETYGEFELNRYDTDTYPVSRDRVLGLQALVMTQLRPIARTHRSQQVRPPKMTGFTILHEDNHLGSSFDTPDELRAALHSDTRDLYFGVMARRLTPRVRRLTLSFLALNNSLESNQQSHRTIHQFLWSSSSDQALGSKRSILAQSKTQLIASRVNLDKQLELKQIIDDTRVVVPEDANPIEFDELEHQVQQTVSLLKPVA